MALAQAEMDIIDITGDGDSDTIAPKARAL